MVFVEVSGIRGVMVKLGLGSPLARGFVAGAVVAGATYLAKFPSAAFRDDGSMRPLKLLSPDPEATTTHFLLVPAVGAAAVFLFT